MRCPVVVAAALAGLLAVAPIGPTRAAPEVEPILGDADGALYAFDGGEAGLHARTYFYDTGRAVVAFDAQFTPRLAEQAIAALRAHTDNPIAYLVITHPNPGKFNGAPAFQRAGATVVASEATALAIPGVHAYQKAFYVGIGAFTAAAYPERAMVDATFSGSTALDLGDGKTVELRELSGPGVSSTQTVAYIPELNALVVGDLVHHRAHAWLEGGIVDGQPRPTIGGWIADLHELEDFYAAHPEPTVYGGRGRPAPLSVAVTDQIAYLQRVDQIVTDYVAGLGDRRSELSGPGAKAHYAAIQTAIERAFPGYAFPELVGFSVYGLVNARL